MNFEYSLLWMAPTGFGDSLRCIWMSVVLLWESGFVDSFTSLCSGFLLA